jgi:hypothetical protein
VCMSERPGMRNFPVPSMTRVPAGMLTLDAEPTAPILPSRTSTVPPMMGVGDAIEITVTFRIANVPRVSAVRETPGAESCGFVNSVAGRDAKRSPVIRNGNLDIEEALNVWRPCSLARGESLGTVLYVSRKIAG